MPDMERDWEADLEVCQKATKGPWEVVRRVSGWDAVFMALACEKLMTYITQWKTEHGERVELLKELRHTENRMQSALDETKAQKAEIARLREALEYYSNELNYIKRCRDVDGDLILIAYDGAGDKAREVLKERD